MATQMETGERKEGRGFGAGHRVGIQDGLWVEVQHSLNQCCHWGGGGSDQEPWDKHLTEPGAELLKNIYFVLIFWGKVGNIILARITYMDKRK